MISIHASAKEATLPPCFTDLRVNPYFNPRLREGGDRNIKQSRLYYQHFNPRLREGGDILLGFVYFSLFISIHASAKEATGTSLVTYEAQIFQSTPPRRRRQSAFILLLTNTDFNPRLREGGDPVPGVFPFLPDQISIHASAKEATFRPVRRICL